MNDGVHEEIFHQNYINTTFKKIEKASNKKASWAAFQFLDFISF